MTLHRVTCTCGHKITGASLYDTWALFDQHVDATHGRSFRVGSVRITSNDERAFRAAQKGAS